MRQQPGSDHLAAGDVDQDFRDERASSDAATQIGKSGRPITITATVAAWVSPGYNQKDLLNAVEGGNSIAAINAAALWGSVDQKTFGDYIRIGEADITLRLAPRDEQVRMAVLALQRQLDDDRKKWLQRQQQILAEISKLQAIAYDAETVDA